MRKSQPKIVVIGAASSSFSGLLADLSGSAELDGAELVLVDIDPGGLALMEKLGRRMVKEWKMKTTVTATTDRREALSGADFVIATIAVGGVTTWRQDDEIPAKHGYAGGAVDTTGPGGLFRGLRLIPPMIDICRDVEELCPGAWVINYSNPMTGICRAVQKATGVNIVGLCTAGYLPSQVAKFMEIDADRITVISGGMNHCVWVLRLLIDGVDRYDEFKAKMRETQAGGWYSSSVELLDIFGVWPMPGSGHVAEFFPYFYGDETEGALDRYPYRKGHDFDKRLARDAERRAELVARSEGEAPLEHKPEESAGEAVRMLTSIWLDRGTVHYGNIRNGGIIPNLPDDAVVEVPVVADGAGIRGMEVGPLPGSIAGLVQARCGYYELLADAALAKSKHIALQCLVADTCTTSIARARACVDELFAAQSEFLPGFE